MLHPADLEHNPYRYTHLGLEVCCSWATENRKIVLAKKGNTLWLEAFDIEEKLISRKPWKLERPLEEEIESLQGRVASIDFQNTIRLDEPLESQGLTVEKNGEKFNLHFDVLEDNQQVWRVSKDDSREIVQLSVESFNSNVLDSSPTAFDLFRQFSMWNLARKAKRAYEKELGKFSPGFDLIEQSYKKHFYPIEWNVGAFQMVLARSGDQSLCLHRTRPEADFDGALGSHSVEEVSRVIQDRIFEEDLTRVRAGLINQWELKSGESIQLRSFGELDQKKLAWIANSEDGNTVIRQIPFQNIRFKPLTPLDQEKRKPCWAKFNIEKVNEFAEILDQYNRNLFRGESLKPFIDSLQRKFTVDRVEGDVVYLTSISFPSKIDPTYTVTEKNWNVTLVCTNGSEGSTSIGAHAEIVLEGVDEGKYFAKLAHLTQKPREIFDYELYLEQKGMERLFRKLFKNMPFDFLPPGKRMGYRDIEGTVLLEDLDFSELKIFERTKVYQIERETGLKMLMAIEKEKGAGPELNRLGCGSMFSDNTSHSCFTWAREKLYPVGVDLGRSIFALFGTDPLRFTEKDQYHKQRREEKLKLRR